MDASPVAPVRAGRRSELWGDTRTLWDAGRIQAKLAVSQPDDPSEREADRIAEQVVRMPAATATATVHRTCSKCTTGSAPCPKCRSDDDVQVQRKTNDAPGGSATSLPDSALRGLGAGEPLDSATRSFLEPRFGHDFAKVRIHADEGAAQSARAIDARAYTLGQDIVFGAGEFQPQTQAGKQLIAHELTHTLQGGAGMSERVQRSPADSHDLESTRFSKLEDLERVYDSELTLEVGSTGRGVQAVQHALYDIGCAVPGAQASGDFDQETAQAVLAFQRANPPLTPVGAVDQPTMATLDRRFGPLELSESSDAVTPECVSAILCPWSPHTVDVLRSMNKVSICAGMELPRDEWNGKRWIKSESWTPTGFTNEAGTEIVAANWAGCPSMAKILYHEAIHAERSASGRSTTALAEESYAYRIGEEFAIATGMSGRTDLRSTDPQGREFADPAKIDPMIESSYPSDPTSEGETLGKGEGRALIDRSHPHRPLPG